MHWLVVLQRVVSTLETLRFLIFDCPLPELGEEIASMVKSLECAIELIGMGAEGSREMCFDAVLKTTKLAHNFFLDVSEHKRRDVQKYLSRHAVTIYVLLLTVRFEGEPPCKEDVSKLVDMYMFARKEGLNELAD